MLYQDINAILAKYDEELTAAGSHGMATGILCANEDANVDLWLQEMLVEDSQIDAEDEQILEHLFIQTNSLLKNDEFSFEMFLPDEDAPLHEQMEGFQQWCQGFLYGLAMATGTESWPDESLEVIKDITEFTKLDPESEGLDAEDDFTELTEYLRTAVIFLHNELNSNPNANLH